MPKPVIVPPPAPQPKKVHLFVATPMYGGICTGFYLQSALQLQQVCGQHGISVTFSFLFNESLIQRGRNVLTQQFLRSAATHFLFVDADIRYDPMSVLQLIQCNKEIICGMYPKKEIHWPTVRKAVQDGVSDDELKYHTGAFVVNLANYKKEQTVPYNEPCEIWNGGTGFMLVKREVFEKLIPHTPWYVNNVKDLGGTVTDDKIYEFFAVAIEPETQTLLSEDYYFCKHARNHGIKVWGAPWVNFAHVGTYAFEGRLTPVPA